ncbi:hypothetical protein RBSH_01888 [Rhodopirellula baltica SH28]|uniref:Uncharacterized protein n=1 Tax=Rhodopirellula baltica SH28 TaxID=993517 RepID=K5D803_RHOBT|nr:hypothetical protein RBSH_01888 [Rhodopirellula baltica SH28]
MTRFPPSFTPETVSISRSLPVPIWGQPYEGGKSHRSKTRAKNAWAD